MITYERQNLKTKFKCLVCSFCGLFIFLVAYGQSNLAPDSLNERRLKAVAISSGVAYIGSMSALYGLWYADYESTSFTFFDDSDEWLGMDKAGHALASYQISRNGFEILALTGLDAQKSMWWSSGVSLLFLTNVEVFDAYSKGWGFSWGDFGANVSGAGLFVGQQLLWQEQRISLKYSYSSSGLARYRPELLGASTAEKLFKDYNGQTIWLSVSPGAFLHEESILPDWLCVSFGYGGSNMLGGSANPEFNEAGEALPDLQPYRQYYLSLDIDLTKIKTDSRVLKTLLSSFAILKIPAPTVEFSQGSTRWYWLYF